MKDILLRKLPEINEANEYAAFNPPIIFWIEASKTRTEEWEVVCKKVINKDEWYYQHGDAYELYRRLKHISFGYGG